MVKNVHCLVFSVLVLFFLSLDADTKLPATPEGVPITQEYFENCTGVAELRRHYTGTGRMQLLTSVILAPVRCLFVPTENDQIRAPLTTR